MANIEGHAVQSSAVAVTMHDVRCGMVNIDPDTASIAPEVMKAVVRANRNRAGVYGTVIRIGRLAAGQTVYFAARAGAGA